MKLNRKDNKEGQNRVSTTKNKGLQSNDKSSFQYKEKGT